MAEASGLPLLSDKNKNPMKTTTFGTGELIIDAAKRGAKKIIIGIYVLIKVRGQLRKGTKF